MKMMEFWDMTIKFLKILVRLFEIGKKSIIHLIKVYIKIRFFI